MFNVINNKFMGFMYQLLVLLLVALSFITITWMRDNIFSVIGSFIVICIPYAMATSRTRDFNQVDIICTTVVLLAYILNVYSASYVKLYDMYTYALVNLSIVAFGYLFHTILYSIVFNVSCARTEYRRFSSAIESNTFVHSIIIFINVIIFGVTSKVGVTLKLLTVGFLLTVVLRVVTKLIVLIIVDYNMSKNGGANEDVKDNAERKN